VYEFCLEDGKGYAKTYCPGLDRPEQFLQSADVPSVEEGGGSQGEVVHVGKHQPYRDPEVEGRNINKEEQRGDRGALGGLDIDGCWGTRCAVKDKCAGTLA